jgi:hypothetical protein
MGNPYIAGPGAGGLTIARAQAPSFSFKTGLAWSALLLDVLPHDLLAPGGHPVAGHALLVRGCEGQAGVRNREPRACLGGARQLCWG